AKSYVDDYAYSKSDADSAVAAAKTALRTEFQSADTATLNSAKSYVENYAYSTSDADSAMASQMTTLRSEFAAGDTQTLADAKNYTYSKAQADNAIAGAIQQVTSRLDDVGGVTLEQAMTTSADKIAGLSGQ